MSSASQDGEGAVKRFWNHVGPLHQAEHPLGIFVLYDDYEKSQRELAAARAERLDAWIPLRERCPTGLDDVLACSTNGRVTVQSAVHLRHLMQDALDNGEDCFYTHWQEMPEPPTRGAK